MTTWADISDYKVADRISAAQVNRFRDDLDFLAQPPLAIYEHSTTGGDFTTNSTQLMVPVDRNVMKVTITSYGGVLLAVFIFSFNISSTTDSIAVDVSIDGSNDYRDGTISRATIISGTSTDEVSCCVIMPIFGLLPGTYTIWPIWATAGGATATIRDDYQPTFAVWEI